MCGTYGAGGVYRVGLGLGPSANESDTPYVAVLQA